MMKNMIWLSFVAILVIAMSAHAQGWAVDVMEARADCDGGVVVVGESDDGVELTVWMSQGQIWVDAGGELIEMGGVSSFGGEVSWYGFSPNFGDVYLWALDGDSELEAIVDLEFPEWDIAPLRWDVHADCDVIAQPARRCVCFSLGQGERPFRCTRLNCIQDNWCEANGNIITAWCEFR